MSGLKKEHIAKASIGNAIRSLYQMIVLIEDSTALCHVIDCDRELENIFSGNCSTFEDLIEGILRNLHPANREDFKIYADPDKIHDRLSRDVFVSVECRLRYADSKYYWTRITLCNGKTEGSPEGREYLFLLQNIQDVKQKELDKDCIYIKQLCKLQNDYDRLFIENMTDEQTGCFNRKGLKYYENIALNKAKKENKNLFVCVLDLNGLKYLNDTFGHAAGDEGLRVVAEALKASVPDNSYIVRTGGDEFLVVGVLDEGSDQPKQMGLKLERFIEEYNNSHGNPYKVGASYGYVMEKISDETDSIDYLIEVADKKMYDMKMRRDDHMRL